MSALKTSLVVLGFSALGAALAWQYRANTALRGELAALQLQVKDLSAQRAVVREDSDRALAAKNTEVANARNESRIELERVRSELTALKTRLNEMARAPQAAAATRPDDAVPLKLIPMSEWKNAGLATPAATLETALWAGAGGDIDTLANTFFLGDRAKERADALFANLSEATRQQYGSPEKLLALMFAREIGVVTGMQVLSQVDRGPEEAMLFMRVGNAEGKTKEEKLPFQLTPGGWRLQFPEKMIDKYERQLKAPAGTGK
jgi:hypothetical protein